MSAHKCEAKTWRGVYGFKTCGKNAVYEYEETWFCKTHYPPNILAKAEIKVAKWEENWKANRKAIDVARTTRVEVYRRADCYPDLLAALIAAQAYVPGSSPVYWQIAYAIDRAKETKP